MLEVRTLIKLMLLPGTLALLSVPGIAGTVPFGPTDGLCTPQADGASQGVTTCLVDEGMQDTLLELVINFTGVFVKVNSVTSGPILPVAGDPGDFITADPIGNGFAGFLGAGPFGMGPVVDCLTQPILAPDTGCTFTQTFTTDALDIGPLMDGESTMSFILGITPPAGGLLVACGNAVGQVLGPTPLGLAYCFGANPTPVDGRGQLLVQITSADVTVNDGVAPEPGTLALLGSGGLAFWIRRRRGLWRGRTALRG